MLSLETLSFYSLFFSVNIISVLSFTLGRDQYPIVRLKSGVIRGFIWEFNDNNDIVAFQGIPYAKPPIGDLRFKAPEPVEPWTGILNATYEGRMCPQQILMMHSDVMGNENCLYLNVYVPKDPHENSKLPVVAFIHGGTFKMLSGTSLLFGPKKLSNLDIILVTFNYRLGALGFLSTGDKTCQGNFGLLDQVLALKWIQENIEYFGGNKNEVTVMGQSAGAMSINLHLISPLSKGLFNKAILESGTIFAANMFEKDPLPKARQLAELAKCPTNNNQELISCLKTKPAGTLIDLENDMDLQNKEPLLPRFTPVIDNTFLPDNPETLYEEGKFHQIPILSGINKDEFMLLIIVDTLLRHMFQQFLKLWPKYKFSFVNSISSSSEEAGIILRKLENEILSDMDIKNATALKYKLSKFFTIAFYLAPEVKFLKYIWRRNPCYVYVFGHRGRFSMLNPSIFQDNESVVHSDELPLLFSGIFDILQGRKEDRIYNMFLQLFANFMKYGNPSPNKHPVHWNPVTSDDIEYLFIRNDFTMKSKYEEKLVQFFNKLLPSQLEEVLLKKLHN